MTATCSNTTVLPFSGEVALPYWQTLWGVAEQYGFDVASLEQTDQKIKGAVSVDHYLALFTKGVVSCEAFGLKIGQSVTLGTFPVIGMTLLSCQNLKQALEQILRYEGLNHDLGISKLISGEGESQYVWTPNRFYLPNLSDQLSFQLALSIFASIQTFVPWLIRDELPIEELGFMVAKPSNVQVYRDFFHVDVKFGQKNNYIRVKNEVLDRSIIGGDVASFSALTSYADNLLLEEAQNSIVWQLKSILPDALRRQAFRVEDLARFLAMSPRSLQRKLKDSGTRFQEVLDEVRKRLAEFYLAENQLSMSEIAFLVGYQEQSSFNHAFKSWNGATPLEYRLTAKKP